MNSALWLAAALSMGGSPATEFKPGPQTWPQWRGPARDGFVAAKSPAWPDKLDANTFKPNWTVADLGPSYSGTIVGEKLVYTTQTLDKKTEIVTAYDRATGTPVWSKQWDGSIAVPFFANKNGSWIRATPTLDGGRLYVPGIRDVLKCFDAKSGDEIWTFDFVKELGSELPTFGSVCSPLCDEKFLYIQAGGHLCKLSKDKGKLEWKTLKDGGGMNGSAFSCPVFATLAGKKQLVVQTREAMFGVDIDGGKELWTKKIATFRGMNILTPITVGDQVFTSTYGGTTQLFNIRSSGDGLKTEDTWSLKYEGYMTTPVVVADHAYFLGKDKKAICVNLKTGKEAWRSEKTYGDYWSLVANGDKILALDSRGKLILFKADPKELEILAEHPLGKSESWAHLSVCGEEVFVRDLVSLTSYRWK